jgi:hypothetical protein
VTTAMYWRRKHPLAECLQYSPFSFNTMKTIAELIGVPNDPGLEAACKVFRSETARIEQAWEQYKKPTPVESRRMDWEAVKKIIAAYEEAKNATI